jgi:MoaA/NifB/PqqE/SkfB family radical SAM enzyme
MPETKVRSYLSHLLRTRLRTLAGRRVTPPFVTLYVTTRCDEKCIHCYYWDELNPKTNRDFTLEEFDKTLASMGEIYNLFIGGGEPFLRADLADILLAAYRRTDVANVYVPTNGQHTARTVEILERTLTEAPAMRFHLNLSVDHVDEGAHDRIRGKERAYQRMLETLDAITPLRRRFRNLIVHTLTTVMKENQDRIIEIYEELQRRFEPDGASFNYCRGHPLDPEQTDVDPVIYKRLMTRMEEDYRRGRIFAAGSSEYNAANHVLDQQVRRSVERTVAEKKAQFSCVSGRLACVIYSNGDVVECEINNSKLGNLRDVDYDFRRLWFTEQAREVADKAANGCFCTHECGHYSSTIYDLGQAVKIAGAAMVTGHSAKVGQ